MEEMDIVTGCSYPASHLSNFEAYTFVIDGITCHSMEGFLQSLKFSEEEKQREVCLLVGKQAKFKGKRKKWWKTQTLYWQGVEIDRHSNVYQELLTRAFDALAENKQFQETLLATGDAVIRHSEGKSDPAKTILTEQEFCSQLMRVRERMKNHVNDQ